MSLPIILIGKKKKVKSLITTFYLNKLKTNILRIVHVFNYYFNRETFLPDCIIYYIQFNTSSFI